MNLMKFIVITGATSGIGKALLDLYCKEKDVTVFAGYRNKDKLSKDLPDFVVPFYIDMFDRNSIVEAADFIKSKTDRVDALINVAGSVIAGPVENIDTQRLREQFEVNTFSHIEFSQNLISVLKNSKIINISSMASFGNFPFISPYCASKRALDIFFNAFALENHDNIKVISIKPGVIATPLWDKSVKINIEYLKTYTKYAKELEYVKYNAIKNGGRGLKVEQVAKFIKNVEKKKNPKSSYTIGIDAKLAEFVSFLPQNLVNKLVKSGMKLKFK